MAAQRNPGGAEDVPPAFASRCVSGHVRSAGILNVTRHQPRREHPRELAPGNFRESPGIGQRGHGMTDQYRVLSGRYRDQIVTIVKRNGSAVQVCTVGVPVAVFWIARKNIEAVPMEA